MSSDFSIIQTFLNIAALGAEWVMWLLLALGLIGLIIVLERALLYFRTRVNAPQLGRQLTLALDAHDLQQAQSLVARGRAMEERVVADALSAFSRGPLVVAHVIQSATARERQRYERFLSYLGTLGNNAPFVGLLGTVIGIIVAFRALGANPKGGLAIVGPGIAEALVATAVGLLIAIPAVAAFNVCKTTIKNRTAQTDFLSGIILAFCERSNAAAVTEENQKENPEI